MLLGSLGPQNVLWNPLDWTTCGQELDAETVDLLPRTALLLPSERNGRNEEKKKIFGGNKASGVRAEGLSCLVPGAGRPLPGEKEKGSATFSEVKYSEIKYSAKTAFKS